MYLRSAFLITFTTYLLLILVEVFEPGFVSNYFSAHWLLLVALVLFVWMIHRGDKLEIRLRMIWSATVMVALIFAVVTWRLGGPLNELRPLLTFVALALPFAVTKLLTFDF